MWRNILPFFSKLIRRIDDLRHEVRYRVHPGHRYHMVDTGLKPGYYDQDKRMLHACFALLISYIDEHDGMGDNDQSGYDVITAHIVDLRATPHLWTGAESWGQESVDAMAPHLERDIETLALYDWWTKERPANWAHCNAWSDKLYKGSTLVTTTRPDGRKALSVDTSSRDESFGTREQRWEYERVLEEQDQTMLHRLVAIRAGLWV